jgi:hypothetical protein
LWVEAGFVDIKLEEAGYSGGAEAKASRCTQAVALEIMVTKDL